MVEKKHEGDNHEGAGRSAPYGLSTLAPATTLVDVAREIVEADTMIAQTTSAKLKTIAEEIRRLQDQARRVLDDAKQDIALHRAACSFSRRIGKIYHLYERADGTLFWSLLSPDDWSPPHTPRGSYRLEADQSWTPVEDIEVATTDDPLAGDELMRRLLPG